MTSLALAFPDDLKEFIDHEVRSGHFAGPNELVASALYAYRDQVELEHVKLRRLRGDIAVGIGQIDRGEGIEDWNLDTFLTEKRTKRQQMAATA